MRSAGYSLNDETHGWVVAAVTARERGPVRRPVPPLSDLGAAGRHLHHVMGSAVTGSAVTGSAGSIVGVTGSAGGLCLDPSGAGDPADAAELARVSAASVGAEDLLVLRRLGSAGWTHLGGSGSGAM